MAKRFDPKAKARKQKIVAAVLGVVLLGVIVYQAPTILGLFGGGSSDVASEPAPLAPPAPTAPTSAAAPAAATPAAGSAQLVDTDVAPEPTQGQLVTFDRFESKDPFAQQAEEDEDGSAGPSETPPAKDSVRAEDGAAAGAQPARPAPPPAKAETATISVNGVSSKVAVGGDFPEDDPTFKLVSLTKTSAKVGIVDGTYATGSATITLKRGGKPVTLMNTADGTTYVLRLVSVG
jgi:hypothetical protein